MIPFKLKHHILESLQNLRLFKLRSTLALLGILIGTAAVVALISSSQLATQHALAQFDNLGTDLFAITLQSPPDSTNTHHLTLAQIAQIKQSLPEILTAAPYTMDFSAIFYDGKAVQGNVIGVTSVLADITNIQMAQGRFISTLDKRPYFCVIGDTIAQRIHDQHTNPIGEQIRIGEHYFTIIGVARRWPENMFFNLDLNEAVMIPIETAFTLNASAAITNLVFKFSPDVDNAHTQQQIQDSLQQLLPQVKWFSRSAKELIHSMQQQRQTFHLLLTAIGSIALVVGGIGIMNVMLVSVVERRREIGIRMAVGAKRRDIQHMFLVESVVLSVAGGGLGIMVGILVSFLIALFSQWVFHFYVLPPLIGFSVSVLVGIFFGFYPAYLAARLKPIEVLRLE